MREQVAEGPRKVTLNVPAELRDVHRREVTIIEHDLEAKRMATVLIDISVQSPRVRDLLEMARQAIEADRRPDYQALHHQLQHIFESQTADWRKRALPQLGELGSPDSFSFTSMIDKAAVRLSARILNAAEGRD